ncbi:hypothetical protein ACFL5K_02520 [Gemmatimonadota bacterium]
MEMTPALEDVSIELAGEGRTLTKTSNADGNYAFTDLLPGINDLFAFSADHYFLPNSQRVIVSIADGRVYHQKR